ncbi:MAG: hypothetical protein PHY16_16810 [Methylobacter sp.]|nr:hypothetical protein [Methylobacter sp.]
MAVIETGAIAKRIFLFAAPRGFQKLPGRTDIAVIDGIIGEVGAPEGAVGAF